MEVGTEGIDGHRGVGIVERADILILGVLSKSEVEVAPVTARKRHGVVDASELDGAESTVRGGDGGSGGAGHGDTVERGIHDVVAACPLDDVGLAGLNGGGVLEIEVEGAVGGEASLAIVVLIVLVGAGGIEFHQRGSCEGRTIERDREGQAEGVPVAVLEERAAL